MKVHHAYQLFMTHGTSERLYAAETTEKHNVCFRAWILPTFFERDVEDITRLDLLSFRERITQKGLSVNSQYSVLMTLKLWLKFCRTILDLKCIDPAAIALPRRPAPHVAFLTNDEVARIREGINIHTSTGLRLRALVEALLGTGLRISEALGLDREPFDKGAREIEIRGKGGKHRVIFLNEDVHHWVRRYLAVRKDTSPALFVTTGPSPHRMNRADISRFFVDLRTRTGINKPLTPHLLRHTYCTNLLANGADIMHIKELAGHSDIQITARYYLGVDRDALRKVAARVDYRQLTRTPPGTLLQH